MYDEADFPLDTLETPLVEAVHKLQGLNGPMEKLWTGDAAEARRANADAPMGAECAPSAGRNQNSGKR